MLKKVKLDKKGNLYIKGNWVGRISKQIMPLVYSVEFSTEAKQFKFVLKNGKVEYMSTIRPDNAAQTDRPSPQS